MNIRFYGENRDTQVSQPQFYEKINVSQGNSFSKQEQTSIKQTMHKSLKDIQLLDYRMQLLKREDVKKSISVKKTQERTQQIYSIKVKAQGHREDRKRVARKEDDGVELQRRRFLDEKRQRQQSLQQVQEQLKQSRYQDMLEIRRQREENDLRIIQNRMDWIGQKTQKRQMVQDRMRQSQGNVDFYWANKLQGYKEERMAEANEHERRLQNNIKRIQTMEGQENSMVTRLNDIQSQQMEEHQKLDYAFKRTATQFKDKFMA